MPPTGAATDQSQSRYRRPGDCTNRAAPELKLDATSRVHAAPAESSKGAVAKQRNFVSSPSAVFTGPAGRIPIFRKGDPEDCLFALCAGTNWDVRRCCGVAEAGHRLNGVLTVAHAVWHFAGVPLGGRPRERTLTRSLRDLTRFAEWARVRAGCLAALTGWQATSSWRYCSGHEAPTRAACHECLSVCSLRRCISMLVSP